MALGQPLAVGADHQRHVGVGDPRQSEEVLQQGLAGRRRQQVVAPADLVDPLGGVVDDDGQVVGRHAVVAAQHDVVGHAP